MPRYVYAKGRVGRTRRREKNSARTAFRPLILITREIPAALGLTALDGPVCGREQSKAVGVVRARAARGKVVGVPTPPNTTLGAAAYPHSVAIAPSCSLARAVASSSLSGRLLSPSRSLPLPLSCAVSLARSSSFRSFLTSNHLGPRTSAVSRSFLAAAFRHFPPDRARAVRQTPFWLSLRRRRRHCHRRHR